MHPYFQGVTLLFARKLFLMEDKKIKDLSKIYIFKIQKFKELSIFYIFINRKITFVQVGVYNRSPPSFL